jgi:hypothetical protein
MYGRCGGCELAVCVCVEDVSLQYVCVEDVSLQYVCVELVCGGCELAVCVCGACVWRM